MDEQQRMMVDDLARTYARLEIEAFCNRLLDHLVKNPKADIKDALREAMGYYEAERG